ncbi:hypothetical protein [Cupriavidus pinatubonensis]|uniref:hypothetical protein n=1 Tax=Cupriavidus pinatubonensis TaxID=248026 RepID=UPI0031455955
MPHTGPRDTRGLAAGALLAALAAMVLALSGLQDRPFRPRAGLTPAQVAVCRSREGFTETDVGWGTRPSAQSPVWLRRRCHPSRSDCRHPAPRRRAARRGHRPCTREMATPITPAAPNTTCGFRCGARKP